MLSSSLPAPPPPHLLCTHLHLPGLCGARSAEWTLSAAPVTDGPRHQIVPSTGPGRVCLVTTISPRARKDICICQMKDHHCSEGETEAQREEPASKATGSRVSKWDRPCGDHSVTRTDWPQAMQGPRCDKTALASSHPVQLFVARDSVPGQPGVWPDAPRLCPPRTELATAPMWPSLSLQSRAQSQGCPPPAPGSPQSLAPHRAGPRDPALRGWSEKWPRNHLESQACPPAGSPPLVPATPHPTPGALDTRRAGAGRGRCLYPPPPPAWQQYPTSPKSSSAPHSSCRYGQGAYRTPAGSRLCLPRAPALLDSSKVSTVCPLKTNM